MFCENCGTKMEDNELFCSNCGEKIQVETGLVVKQDEVNTLSTIPVNNERKFVRKKGYISAISAIVIIALLATSIILMNPFAKASDQIIYLKGSNLMLTDGKMKNPKIITSSFYVDEIIEDAEEASEKVEGASGLLNIGYVKSQDEKFIFYIDNLNDEKYSIFRAPANNLDKKTLIVTNAIPLSSEWDSSTFKLINNDNGIIYQKDGHDDAYFYSDFTTEKKIINNGHIISMDDSGKILYKQYDPKTSETQLYSMDIMTTDAPTLIDKGPVGWILKDDSNNPLDVYYMVEDSSDSSNCNSVKAYKNGVSKEIFGDCEYVLNNVYDGGVYVAVSKNQSINFSSMLNDDMLQLDQTILEPNQDEYTHTVLKTDYWFGTQYYEDEVDFDRYNEAYNKYQEKVTRDNVRNYINNNKYTYNSYDIYYIKDGKSTLVTDKYSNIVFDDNIGTVFEEIDYSDTGEIKMSDIYNDLNYYYYDYQLEEKFNAMVSQNSNKKLLYKGELYSVSEQAEGSNFVTLMDCGKSNQILSVINNSSGECDLVELNLNKEDSTISEKVIDTNVSLSKIINEGKTIYYYRPKENEDFYNQELKIYENNVSKTISDNVTMGTCMFGETGEIYFISDYQDNHLGGSFMKFNKGELSTIATNVMQYYITPKKELYYLANLDKNGNGTLFKKSKIDQDSKVKQIDTGVTGLRGVGAIYSNGFDLYDIYETNLNTAMF